MKIFRRNKASKVSQYMSVCLLGLIMPVAAEPESDVVAKEMIQQWVATERLLGEELNDWNEEKAQVSELLVLYKQELALLNEELEKGGQSVEEVDQRKGELEAKAADGVQSRKALRAYLVRIAPRVLAVEERFPTVLQVQLDSSVRVLKGLNDETSARELLTAIITVLEQAMQFNAGVYQSNESITIGAETWNADVLYMGLSRAYFTVGSKAGVGEPTANGWVWERKDELVDSVKSAVKVFKKETQPTLVELPVKVGK